tara:strand:+ start:412 stop:4758 length:4347 start_codon:yes stop_codon:yes gene_type:complete
MNAALEPFSPLIRSWFSRLGEPTDAQTLAWPHIVAGEHLVVSAPTGSGKTLTAFLWSINQFLTGALAPGATRVLYISPLKALNNDVRRNLLSPLAELAEMAADQGEPFPRIRVQTRSGDTEQGDRRRMLRHPPEILITTPESLNLLLSSKGGQSILQSIDTVILDEIHSVVGNKRGVYLMSAVERLIGLSGEFQRIALSATVRPIETVAEYVGGLVDGRARPVTIVRSRAAKQYELAVRYPIAARDRTDDDDLWDALAPDFVERIERNRSTLLFVNSRALCEKLTLKINNAAGRIVAWAHHGSLSREIRTEVEARLKSGELAAIVATSSLELGIDVGALDEVILIQSPDSVSSTIQRIGRAGHGVGDVSHCTIYPTHPRDFIEASVLVQAVLERDIEQLNPVECPLDVLAQILISMTGLEARPRDVLFDEVRASFPYRNLTRNQFDLVINMLAGRYADNHIRELRPRVVVDRIDDTIQARKGALQSLYLSGGVIPDRGYFNLRHADSDARIGELDEEFVWEANVGKVFSFGTQHWQIRKITHNDVFVSEGRGNTSGPPFWKAESINRDFHFAERVGNFLENANDVLDEPGFATALRDEWRLEETSAEEVVTFLRRQKEHTGTDLPHRHHLLVERVSVAPGGAPGHQAVLHTGWGARVNRPLAMALEAAWQETWGEQPEVHASNDCLVLQLPHEIDATALLAMVPARDVERLLRRRLEGSGFFGARFRESAGRALLLSKGRFNQRKPLWMSRLQSQKLMDAVFKYEDFPILLETWRTCLVDEFDLDSLAQVLAEIEGGVIRVSDVATSSPSPFAQSVAWDQINLYMYMDDQPKADRQSNLRGDLLQEVVFSPNLRPPIPRDVIDAFVARRQRRVEGYAPETPEDLLEWIKERTLLAQTEFTELSAVTGTDGITDRLARGTGTSHDVIVALEDAAALASATGGIVRFARLDGPTLAPSALDPDVLETHLGNWLQHAGPLALDEIRQGFPAPGDAIDAALDTLVAKRELVTGALREGETTVCWCDADNYEVLLRMLRRSRQPTFEPRPGHELTPFLYAWQTRFTSPDRLDRLFETLERLRNYCAPAGLWETELLPARLAGYTTADLDLLFQEGSTCWLGQGEARVTFAFADDLDLLEAPADPDLTLFPDPRGRYDFGSLLDATGLSSGELADRLWALTWAGVTSNDSIAALRRGIQTGFSGPAVEPPAAGRTRRRTRRGAFNRWRTSVPFDGNWQAVPWPAANDDLLAGEERTRERARVLLDRYGVVFRELLLRETDAFQWRSVFRALRLMELSGEALSGYFFRDIPGPQFTTPAALRMLQSFDPKGVFWINALDPISLSGLQVPELRVDLPRRVAGHHMVYADGELALVSERNGRVLTIMLEPEDCHLAEVYGVLRHLLLRSFEPRRKVTIDTINDIAAPRSPYLASLRDCFDVVADYKSVYIQRRVGEI